MKNKKGAEKILSIYWFIILIITVVGIYGMINLYYSHPYDIRELEANLLANRIADCISYKGKIIKDIFNETTKEISLEFSDNLLDICGIIFDVEDEHGWRKTKREQYYIEVNFYDIDKNFLGKITKGNKILKGHCEELEREKIYEKLPKCVNKRFCSIDKEGNQILIDIFTAVRKTEKNVK